MCECGIAIETTTTNNDKYNKIGSVCGNWLRFFAFDECHCPSSFVQHKYQLVSSHFFSLSLAVSLSSSHHISHSMHAYILPHSRIYTTNRHTHTHRRQNMQHKVIVAGKHCSIVKRQNYSEGFGQLWSCIKTVCLFNCPQCPVNRTVITNPVHHKQSAGSWCILRIIRVIAKLKTNHIHCVYML